eukprot:13704120-Alexandrium_andersonii.AAC.1
MCIRDSTCAGSQSPPRIGQGALVGLPVLCMGSTACAPASLMSSSSPPFGRRSCSAATGARRRLTRPAPRARSLP